ncbi:hypothetical protein EBZ38_12695 [bacterium]|nr:hypothetical protein [bacterium]NDD85115.1 hypothetical protein [bacterium]
MLIRKHRPVKGRTLKQKNPKILKKLALAFAIVIIAFVAYIKIQPHTFEAKQRVKLESTVQQLKTTKQQLIDEQSKSKAEDDAKAKQIEELNKQIQEKDAQLQAKAAAKTAYAASAPQQAKTYPVPEDEAKAFIYMHESSNNPAAVNSIGCRGLGQACPGSKLPCSSSDYACQDAWFTNYMLQRYGSWNNARAFWIANNWW